ncbi:MAG: hypothetical protein RJA34_3327 [Pseudomonadota bacterium]
MSFGRLERTRPSEPMSEINMTPLIDVMLVLLVIFMLAAPLMTSRLKLDLPQSGAAQAGQPPQAVRLQIDRSGQAFLDERPVSDADLAAALTLVAQQTPDAEVQLRADRSVAYGRIVEVMGSAQQAGLTRIGFVAEAKP